LKKYLLTINSFLISWFLFSTYAFAGVISAAEAEQNLYKVAGEGYRWIQIGGVSIAVVIIAVYGIKWFFASPQDKATLRSNLWVYVIGMILLLGGAGIAEIVLTKMHSLFDIIPVNSAPHI